MRVDDPTSFGAASRRISRASPTTTPVCPTKRGLHSNSASELYIVPPTAKRAVTNLFSTHPPLEAPAAALSRAQNLSSRARR